MEKAPIIDLSEIKYASKNLKR